MSGSEPSTKPKASQKQRLRGKKRSVWTRQKLPRVYFSSPTERKKYREFSYERKQKLVIEQVWKERETKAKAAVFESSSDSSTESELSDPEEQLACTSNQRGKHFGSTISATYCKQQLNSRAGNCIVKSSTFSAQSGIATTSHSHHYASGANKPPTAKPLNQQYHQAARMQHKDGAQIPKSISCNADVRGIADGNNKRRTPAPVMDHGHSKKRLTAEVSSYASNEYPASERHLRAAKLNGSTQAQGHDEAAEIPDTKCGVLPIMFVKHELDYDAKPCTSDFVNDHAELHVGAPEGNLERPNRAAKPDSRSTNPPSTTRRYQDETVSDSECSLNSEQIRLARRQCNSIRLNRRRCQIGQNLYDSNDSARRSNVVDMRSHEAAPSRERSNSGNDYSYIDTRLHRPDGAASGDEEQGQNGESVKLTASGANQNGSRFAYFPRHNVKKFGCPTKRLNGSATMGTCTATRFFVCSGGGRQLGASGVFEIGASCIKPATFTRKPSIFAVVSAEKLQVVTNGRKTTVSSGDYFFVGSDVNFGFENPSNRDAILSYTQFAVDSNCNVVMGNPSNTLVLEGDRLQSQSNAALNGPVRKGLLKR